jgi:hypothetical protein
MYKIKWFCLIVICVLLSSCRRDDNFDIFFPGHQEYGWATAKKYDKNWAASTCIRVDPNDEKLITIFLPTYDFIGVLAESVSFRVPARTGRYEKVDVEGKEPEGFYAGCILTNDDIILAAYEIDVLAENFVEITYLDTLTGVVKGEFQLFFNGKEGYGSAEFADRVELTEGKFEGLIRATGCD